MKERGLFIGRFQPFHKGHLSVIEQIDKVEDVPEIIIGVGSAQYHHTLINPFTFEERAGMIKASLALTKPYNIVEIPDIHDYPKWIDHVRNLVPDFSVVYAGNKIVRELFEEKGYQVRSIEKHYPFSATDVREKMLFGEDWSDYLPQGSLDVLAQIRGVDRIREIYHRFIRPSVTADIIVEYQDQGLVLIQRQEETVFGGYWALPGGFLEAGKESARQAAARELGEETSLQLDPMSLQLVGEHSNPQRDPRDYVVSLVYAVKIDGGNLQARDDAQDIRVFPFDQLPENLAFDHHQIIADYLAQKRLQL